MKLTKFSIKNFRSITDASEINLNHYSVLVGRNNEGKTTVLLGLKMAMDALRRHSRGMSRMFRTRDGYEWERDFPISLQQKARIKKETVFRLYFILDEAEQLEFKREIKCISNSDLCIEITFSENNEPKFIVPKRGSKALTKKSEEIAKYIAERIQFTYIPAVRTEQAAISAINEMIMEELSKLENEEDYKQAFEVILNLQKPVLDKVSKTIQTSLQKFLPNITQVSLDISVYERRSRLRSDYHIEIDDGNKTDIKFKGDGVKSLAAVGMLKDRQKIHNGASIIAIEEPESHLHPSAMHTLKYALEELSLDNQLIISTHNPIFVHRDKITNNILVSSNKVKVVRKIKEIRDCLGVRTSDNLVNANKIILVEGESDKKIINKLIQEKSVRLNKMIKDGDLIIFSLDGASKLSYYLKLFQDQLCACFIILDNDSEAKNQINKHLASKELKQNSYCHLIAKGLSESEIENFINLEFYKDNIFKKFGIDIEASDFTKKKKKWSDSLKEALESLGKNVTLSDLDEMKKSIAEKSEKNGVYSNIYAHNRQLIDHLISQIENYFIK